MKSRYLLAFSALISISFIGCSSHSKAQKVLPKELIPANECKNANISLEYDCYGLMSSRNTFALLRLGIAAEEKSDYKLAYKLYVQAKEKGNYYANALMARLLLRGLGVPRNTDLAIDLLEDVEDIDPMAAYVLASYYKKIQKYKKMIKYYEIAGKKGLKKAQLALSRLYSDGRYIELNDEKGMFWASAYKNNSNDVEKRIYNKSVLK